MTSLTGQHHCHHTIYMWKEWSSGQLNSLLSLTIQYHDNLYSEVNSVINLIESPKATITPTSSYETASDIKKRCLHGVYFEKVVKLAWSKEPSIYLQRIYIHWINILNFLKKTSAGWILWLISLSRKKFIERKFEVLQSDELKVTMKRPLTAKQAVVEVVSGTQWAKGLV